MGASNLVRKWSLVNTCEKNLKFKSWNQKCKSNYKPSHPRVKLCIVSVFFFVLKKINKQTNKHYADNRKHNIIFSRVISSALSVWGLCSNLETMDSLVQWKMGACYSYVKSKGCAVTSYTRPLYYRHHRKKNFPAISVN